MSIQKYVVKGAAVEFHGGVLELTPEQSGPRLHNLTPMKGKLFSVTPGKSVQFKVGEVIGLEEVPKAYIDRLEPVKAPAAKDKE